MKNILLMFVLLITSLTNAQNFDFSCGPTAEEIRTSRIEAIDAKINELIPHAESSNFSIERDIFTPYSGDSYDIVNFYSNIIPSPNYGSVDAKYSIKPANQTVNVEDLGETEFKNWLDGFNQNVITLKSFIRPIFIAQVDAIIAENETANISIEHADASIYGGTGDAVVFIVDGEIISNVQANGLLEDKIQFQVTDYLNRIVLEANRINAPIVLQGQINEFLSIGNESKYYTQLVHNPYCEIDCISTFQYLTDAGTPNDFTDDSLIDETSLNGNLADLDTEAINNVISSIRNIVNGLIQSDIDAANSESNSLYDLPTGNRRDAIDALDNELINYQEHSVNTLYDQVRDKNAVIITDNNVKVFEWDLSLFSDLGDPEWAELWEDIVDEVVKLNNQ